MRTGQVAATAIAVGMMGLLLLASMPSASACSLTSGTPCLMAIYKNNRDQALSYVGGASGMVAGKVGEAQGTFDAAKSGAESKASAMDAWRQYAQAYEAGCVPGSGGPNPNLPGFDPGSITPEAGVVEPAVDLANLAVSDAGAFAGASVDNPFTAAQEYILATWGHGSEFALTVDSSFIQPTLEGAFGAVQSVNITAPEVPALPPLPEPPTVGELGSLVSDTTAAAEEGLTGLSAQADCHAAVDLPPL